MITIITEDDLRAYARGDISKDVADEIDALVAQDEEADKRLRSFINAQQAGQLQGKEHHNMLKDSKDKRAAIKATVTEALQAVERRTNRRALFGGLALTGIMVAVGFAFGLAGYGDDIIAALPEFFAPEDAV